MRRVAVRFVAGHVWLAAGPAMAMGLISIRLCRHEGVTMAFGGPRAKAAKAARKKAKPRAKVKRRDPIFIDGARPRPLYVDYKDLELLGKLVNRQAKIIGRRKTGCTAASQHAVTAAIKRARFMALLPYVGE
jgi:small subunit ribosomal protein S18